MRGSALAICSACAIAAPAGEALADGEMRAFGEYLASECVTCHQISGDYKGIPPIIGWDKSTFMEAMKSYRAKTRKNEVMQTVAGGLSDEEIEALAVYFGSLKP